jgi:hypothetical protein
MRWPEFLTLASSGANDMNTDDTKLKFGSGNAKLQAGQVIFDLPAGHSCPFASKCLAFAAPIDGKITDGPKAEFRCYAASQEAAFSNVRRKRWHNFEALRGLSEAQMTRLIVASLPEASLYRVHSSGDFFSLRYFRAWLSVARQFPERTFYAYTKAIKFWIACKDEIPPNFKLTASMGGTHDALIAEHGLKNARVVYSQAEADATGLEIDHDDSHAFAGEDSFALLIHGTQPAGTKSAAAWQVVRAAKMAAV